MKKRSILAAMIRASSRISGMTYARRHVAEADDAVGKGGVVGLFSKLVR
jgi:hypothetical protein